jgi:hypothetical protein
MNTILKSALFAAVILFGGLYVADMVYNKVAVTPAGDVAALEPAAGDEEMFEDGTMADDASASVAPEGEEEIFVIDGEAEANNGNILEVIEQEAEMASEDASETAQEAANEVEDAMNDAAQTEPAAGEEMDEMDAPYDNMDADENSVPEEDTAQ